MQFHPGEEVTVTYERDGKRYQTELGAPKYNEEYGYSMYGFQASGQREKGNVLETLKYSVYEVRYWINVTLNSVKALVTGQVSVNDMSGPVGIVDMIGDGYEQSISYGYIAAFLQMLYITIFLSANLGVMNLLPLPALDGGKAFIYGHRDHPRKARGSGQGRNGAFYRHDAVICIYDIYHIQRCTKAVWLTGRYAYDKNGSDWQTR